MHVQHTALMLKSWCWLPLFPTLRSQPQPQEEQWNSWVDMTEENTSFLTLLSISHSFTQHLFVEDPLMAGSAPCIGYSCEKPRWSPIFTEFIVYLSVNCKRNKSTQEWSQKPSHSMIHQSVLLIIKPINWQLPNEARFMLIFMAWEVIQPAFLLHPLSH